MATIPRAARRILALVLAALAAAALAAGCGEEGSGAGTAATAPAGSAFPVTVEHSLGETVVPEAPARVVAVGYGDIDVALSLGVVPVLMPEIPDSDPSGIPPWVSARLGGERPTLVDRSSAIPFEKIAAAGPDLILALDDFGDDQEKLAGIAPTVAPVDQGYLDRWDEKVRLAGRALGREGRAERAIADVKAKIAAIGRDYPELAGKTVTYAWTDGSTLMVVNSPESPTFSVFGLIGLERSPAVAALPPTGQAVWNTLSLERIDVLEADLLAVGYASPQARRSFESTPLFQRLGVVRRGAYIAMDDATGRALIDATVLSIPYALDRLVPQFARALR